eukprot:jgi/Tetstr1/434970/TSEL_023961.t1
MKKDQISLLDTGQRKPSSKSKKGNTKRSGYPEGSGGKEVTGDTDDELEDIEEIKGSGDPVIRAADGMTELEEAEIEV